MKGFIRIAMSSVLIIVMLLSPALSETKDMSVMSIEELYALEDLLVDAIRAAFEKTASSMVGHELIGTWVINPRTKKFHYPWCYSALQIGTDRQFRTCAASELVGDNYSPCGQCKPVAD